ncbi:MAG: PGF-pre-PGF domain-containing protein [Archaeoglobaceae archaeon]
MNKVLTLLVWVYLISTASALVTSINVYSDVSMGSEGEIVFRVNGDPPFVVGINFTVPEGFTLIECLPNYKISGNKVAIALVGESEAKCKVRAPFKYDISYDLNGYWIDMLSENEGSIIEKINLKTPPKTYKGPASSPHLSDVLRVNIIEISDTEVYEGDTITLYVDTATYKDVTRYVAIIDVYDYMNLKKSINEIDTTGVASKAKWRVTLGEEGKINEFTVNTSRYDIDVGYYVVVVYINKTAFDDSLIFRVKFSGTSKEETKTTPSITQNSLTSKLYLEMNTERKLIVSSDLMKQINILGLSIKSNETTEANISISKLPSLPSGVKSPPGILLYVWDITLKSSKPASFEGYIEFLIERSIISEKGYNPDDAEIVFLRYDREWSELNATLFKKDDAYTYYIVKTPGFSYFTAVIKAPETSTQQTPAFSQAPPSTQSPSTHPSSQPSTQTSQRTAEYQTTTAPSSQINAQSSTFLNLELVILIMLGMMGVTIVILIGFMVLMFRIGGERR